ncbi:MAG: peptidoglycan DD-metalloendopeptidase family protein [Clostridia bacterium]|nr:peptidoglycan DD-metalloendopeptidase family protein [Clostridia bacterium]
MYHTAKRFFAILLAVAVLTGMFAVAAYADAGVQTFGRTGDLNGDGMVNSSDARYLLRAVARLESLNDAQRRNADINRDGRVDSIDARLLLRISARLVCYTANGELPSDVRLLWPVQDDSRYTTTEYGQNGHGGLDITCSGASQMDKQIVAAADGVVTAVAWHWSYGNYVVIDHGNGLSTMYAHCHSVAVAVEQTVAQGQPIGIIGNSGYAFGAHVHFEVHVNGVRQNPRNYL